VRDTWLEAKISMTKKLGWTALVGLVPFVILFLVPDDSTLAKGILAFLAIIMIIPFILYLNILTIWHWKRRYRGEKSDLWGVVLLIETSGSFKIIYWFRHILPDFRGSGRYSENRIV
jgi:hypothetical protein